jgi:hypothetical protein
MNRLERVLFKKRASYQSLTYFSQYAMGMN